MENPEEILHSLEEFSKCRPKDIPRDLEEYLCFVARTGDPVYQWSSIKCLFREKLINVVNEFYDSCPLIDIPQCRNVEVFKYDTMKAFILEKLDTFAAAPFTVQRICELLTSPRKEYNRIDKYMRALEKTILVVSTIEPGCKSAENGDSIVNGLESEHLPGSSNCSSEINVDEMDDSAIWHKYEQTKMLLQDTEEMNKNDNLLSEETKLNEESTCTSSEDAVLETEKESKPEVPVNSSIEESTDNLISVEISVDPLHIPAAYESNSEAEVTSEVQEVDETTVGFNDIKEEETTENKTEFQDLLIGERLKQADSTTSLKFFQGGDTDSPKDLESPEITCPDDGTEKESEEISASEESRALEESSDNEVKDENKSQIVESIEECCESAVDTTKDHAVSTEIDSDETKEEEISSSDKVVSAVPNTTIDDISDEECEAKAEAPKEVIEQEEEQTLHVDKGIADNEPEVTGSSDDIKKDILMEVDVKEEADFNEAEATSETV